MRIRLPCHTQSHPGRPHHNRDAERDRVRKGPVGYVLLCVSARAPGIYAASVSYVSVNESRSVSFVCANTRFRCPGLCGTVRHLSALSLLGAISTWRPFLPSTHFPHPHHAREVSRVGLFLSRYPRPPFRRVGNWRRLSNTSCLPPSPPPFPPAPFAFRLAAATLGRPSASS